MENIKKAVLDFFKSSAMSDGSKETTLTIGQLTPEGKAYLSALSGLRFKTYVDVTLNSSDLRHVYNDHYGQNEKDMGSNNPLTDEDIENMVEVFASPNKILFVGYSSKNQSNRFVFLKASKAGTYNLIEVHRSKGGQLAAKTFLNTKKGVNQRISELEIPTDLPPNGHAISQRTVGETPLFSTSGTYSGASHVSENPPRMMNLDGCKGTNNFSNNQILEKKNVQKAIPSSALRVASAQEQAAQVLPEEKNYVQQKLS
jgi:hypothetical protein